MKYMYKLFVLALLIFASQYSIAQIQDPTSPTYDATSPDTTIVDSNAIIEETPAQPVAPIDPFLKPYEKIILNVDSTTNLITYNMIVEQEESGSDSLYVRIKRWIQINLGKDVKVEMDKRNQKLVYIGNIPAYAYISKYTKREIGRFEFKITFLIKEGRYKFQITNLVHETVKPADGGKSNRNYFEYYYTSTTKIRENDIILRNANKDILKMMENIRFYLKEPALVDEDDW